MRRSILIVVLSAAAVGQAACTSAPPAGLVLGPATESQALRDQESRAREIPLNLDLAKKKRSESGKRQISIRAAPSRLELNRVHNWWIRIADRDGRPLDDLRLRFAGGMPAHGHGFPTAPRVTRNIGNGTYLVEGVKFNMSGWWEFVIEFLDPQSGVEDRVQFNLVIDE